jgi:hypothetical protein
MESPDQMKIINETKNENSTMMQNQDDFIVVQTQDALREASDLESNEQPSHSTDEMYKNMNQMIDIHGSQREANDSTAQNETFRNEYQFASNKQSPRFNYNSQSIQLLDNANPF